MKKILSILVTLTFCASTLWAKQVTVDLYNANKQPLPTSHELIIQTAGSTNTKAVENWWDGNGFINPFTSTDWGTITFAALEGTILGTYKFDVHNHSSWISKPKYKINDGQEQTISSDKTESNDNYYQSSLKIHGKYSSVFGDNRYPRFKNFQFTVLIPEVFDRSIQTTELEALSNSDLAANIISRKGYVPFLVKDPIDTSNPMTYFDATRSSLTGENWEILTTGWVCVPNTPENREVYKINDTEPGTYIIAVPVQYTATTKQRGNFEATVKLSSKNTYDNSEDEQKVIIAVAEKQNYAIAWG